MMTDATIPFHKRIEGDAATDVLVYAPDPEAAALVEIRRLVDDKRLNWAIWPTGRP